MNRRQSRQVPQNGRGVATKSSRGRLHGEPEAEFLLAFARTWAPFGGAPDEEILVHFGMTTSRFIECLWQVVATSKMAPQDVRALASAYTHEPSAPGPDARSTAANRNSNNLSR